MLEIEIKLTLKWRLPNHLQRFTTQQKRNMQTAGTTVHYTVQISADWYMYSVEQLYMHGTMILQYINHVCLFSCFCILLPSAQIWQIKVY